MFNIAHSQNFLRSAGLVRTLIQKSSITENDTVLDIGAGKGIITEELARRAKHVEAIEMDPSLCGELQSRLGHYSNVTIRCEDFLAYSLPNVDYKVFANIPYARTADILKKLLEAEHPPMGAHLIVQREAAHKYAGMPYRPETLVSLSRKPWFTFEILHSFRKNDFEPVPKVASVLLSIMQRERPAVTVAQESLYLDFLAYGFTANEPSLKKAYKDVFGHEEFKHLARELRFELDAKPTDLDFEQWLGMFNYYSTGVVKAKKDQLAGAWHQLVSQQRNLEKRHRTTNL